MCKNVGTVDRIVRAIVGVVALIASLFFIEGTLQWILGGIGVMMLFIAITSSCPLYSLLNISSCKVED